MKKQAMMPEENSPRLMLSNMTVRLLTALFFIPLGIFGMFIGGWVWLAMIAVLIVLGLLEFYSLAHTRTIRGSTLVGIPVGLVLAYVFYLERPVLIPLVLAVGAVISVIALWLQRPGSVIHALLQMLTTLAGLLYVALPLGMLVGIRQLPQGFLWVVVVFGVTWGTDTFAYFGGRMWGRRKLAPRLSPNKTVEGALVGLVGGFVPALLFLLRGQQLNTLTLLWIALAPFIAIAGDLLESAIKRFFHAKDSHLRGLNVIPGHGGVLDRIDALILVTTFSYGFILLTGIAA